MGDGRHLAITRSVADSGHARQPPQSRRHMPLAMDSRALPEVRACSLIGA